MYKCQTASRYHQGQTDNLRTDNLEPQPPSGDQAGVLPGAGAGAGAGAAGGVPPGEARREGEH